MNKDISVRPKIRATKLTVLIGTLGVMFSAAGWTNYGVVLGSFNDREIALETRSELPNQQALMILVSGTDDGTKFRLLDGPHAGYRAASEQLEYWREQGRDDAWITPLELPESAKTGDYK